MIQSTDTDVALLQEVGLNDEIAYNFEIQFPLIKIASNEGGFRGGVVVIINARTTEWNTTPDTKEHVLHKDSNGRLLICNIKVRGRLLVVVSVYAPVESP